ncbi:MAG TPA: acyltransferase [Polyangiaceae bacterium]|nr:acyltransferase [Polyangiaceae bacterium]
MSDIVCPLKRAYSLFGLEIGLGIRHKKDTDASIGRRASVRTMNHGRAGGRIKRRIDAIAEELRMQPRNVAARAVSASLPRFGLNRTRTQLLRWIGLDIGPGSLVMGPIDLTGPGDARELLSIGRDTYISAPLHIDIGAAVRIGDRINIGHDVALLTIDHEIRDGDRRCGELRGEPIRIEDGAWLGSRATILPGVTVGRGAIVAAGAVVTKDVPADTMVAGVPAKVVRQLDAPAGEQQHRRDADR